MKLISKKQIKNFLNEGYDIMIIPYSEKVLNYSSSVFWKTDGKIYSWNRHMGRIERTDKTEEEIIEHIAKFMCDDDYIVNAAGY